jgi:hypothetical protein
MRGGRRRGLTFLAIILIAGFSVRLAYLLDVTARPGYQWADPDQYRSKGLMLAGHGEGWRWTFDAVQHSARDGRQYVLPPLYPTFLSLFALFPSYPFNAQVAQVVLSTVSIGLLFLLGEQIHSRRAGMVAAAVFAAWLPNIIAVWSTMQEALYVPLVLAAFVLLLRSVEKDSGFLGLTLPGAVFALAALTRSLPLYYLPVASVLIGARGLRKGARQIAGLVVGFGLLTVPYSVALSSHLGEVTFIENHGSIRILENYAGYQEDRPPSLTDTAAILFRELADSPRDVLSQWRESGRSVLHLNGGRLLQIYLGAENETAALLAKIAAHGLADLLFVTSLLLAPFGLVLCRRERLAWFLALWILINFGLTAISGFGGARLRAPFEPHLIVLAAVVLAGNYRKTTGFGLVAALVCTVALAGIVMPQVPASLRARAEYGVVWPPGKAPPKRSPITGKAGFNVLATNGDVEFAVRPRNPLGQTSVEVYLEGEHAEDVFVDRGEHWFRYAWPRIELVHVEVRVKDVRTGRPVKVLLILPGDRQPG